MGEDLVAAFRLCSVAGFAGVEVRLSCFAVHDFSGLGDPERFCHAFIRFMHIVSCKIKVVSYIDP
jgi:hypothetical protein